MRKIDPLEVERATGGSSDSRKKAVRRKVKLPGEVRHVERTESAIEIGTRLKLAAKLERLAHG